MLRNDNAGASVEEGVQEGGVWAGRRRTHPQASEAQSGELSVRVYIVLARAREGGNRRGASLLVYDTRVGTSVATHDAHGVHRKERRTRMMVSALSELTTR